MIDRNPTQWNAIYTLCVFLQNTFEYGSAYWTNKETYTPSAGETGFDDQETKLSTYWGVSFTKVCLGMKEGSTLRWTPLSYVGASLHALIADGTYRPTSKTRNSWKLLLSSGSLQVRRRGNPTLFSNGDQHNNNKNSFPLSLSGYISKYYRNLKSGWTPEITLRVNLVGCPLY